MPKYFFARCELDTDRHEFRVSGLPRYIEPQVFDLLELFVERGSNLVSREDLIERIWRGRIVSDSAISVRINAARKAVGDNGTLQSVIRTVPRKGFKLAVEVTRLESDSSSLIQGSTLPSAERDLFAETDNRPVLAVLPFDSAGDTPDFLARGIADDIATELSRFHSLAVVSTFSTFKLDSETGSVPDFAASLGATHIVTGSIQLAGNALRLTAKLGDIATNRCIWSQRYDLDRSEVFDAQDDVVSKIVSNLFRQLHDYQMAGARHKPTSNLSAYDCVTSILRSRETPSTRTGTGTTGAWCCSHMATTRSRSTIFRKVRRAWKQGQSIRLHATPPWVRNPARRRSSMNFAAGTRPSAWNGSNAHIPTAATRTTGT